MRKILIFFMVLWFPLFANAQAQRAPYFYGNGQGSDVSYWKSFIGNPFATTAANSSGATMAANADIYLPSGVKVPVAASASFTAAQIAGAALGCMAPTTVFGAAVCAATVAQTYTELKNHGTFGTCANGTPNAYPGAVCKPNVVYYWTSGSVGCFSTDLCSLSAAAAARVNAYIAGGNDCSVLISVANDGAVHVDVCAHISGAVYHSNVLSYVNQLGVNADLSGTAVATNSDVLAEMSRIAAADNAENQRLLQAMR